MTQKDAFDWAELAGEKRAAKESEALAKKVADIAAEDRQKQIDKAREVEFKKRVEKLLESLSNQIQFAVNAFNRKAGPDTQALPPTRNPHGKLGILLALQIAVRNPELPGMGYPPKQLQTTVEVSIMEKTLEVSHLHAPGRSATIEYRNIRDLSKSDSFLLGTGENGELIVRDGERTIAPDELVKRICLPLFEFVEE